MSNRADNFNRADSGTLGTPSDGGSAWVALQGTWGISGNRAYNSSNGSNDLAVLESGLADVEVRVTAAVFGTYPTVAFRVSDNSNYWQCTFEAAQCYLHKNVAGSFTLVGGTHAATFAAGDVLGVRAVGGQITVTHNGSDLYGVTDSFNSTATQHGFQAYQDTAVRYDDFSTVAAASTYTLSGPANGAAGSTSGAFTVTPNGAYTGTITITPSGGGLSTPITLTFSDSAAAQTFTITPPSAGTVTLTPTASPALTNPAALSYVSLRPSATTYTLTPPSPSESLNGTASAPFSVSLDGYYTGTITPADGGAGGTFTPTSLSWSSDATVKTFTYTPAAAGPLTISATSSPALTDPPGVSFVSLTYATTYTLSGPTSGDCGAPFKWQINVPPDGTNNSPPCVHQTPRNTFTVALPAYKTLAAPVTVTLADDGRTGHVGEFFPGGTAQTGATPLAGNQVTLSNSARSVTVDYVAHQWGSRTLTASSGGALTDPAAASFLAKVQVGSSGTYGGTSAIVGNDRGHGHGANQCLDLGGFNFFGTTHGLATNTDPFWAELGRATASGTTDLDATHPLSDTLLRALSRGNDPSTITVGFNFGCSGWPDTDGQYCDSRQNFPINVVPGDLPTIPVRCSTYPNPDLPLAHAGDTAHYVNLPVFPTMSLENWQADFSGQATAPSTYDGNDRHGIVFVRDDTPGSATEGGIAHLVEVQTPVVEGGGADWAVVSGMNVAVGTPPADGYPTGDAAGLPMGPLYLRYDEALAGDINHPLRVDFPVDILKRVWPARATAGYGVADTYLRLAADAASGATTLTINPAGTGTTNVLRAGAGVTFAGGATATLGADWNQSDTTVTLAAPGLSAAAKAGDAAFLANYTAMGMRLRLTAAHWSAHRGDLNSYPVARNVFDALRNYGVILADGSGLGSNIQLCGVNDSRWSSGELIALAAVLPQSAFEFVVPPEHYRITAPATGTTGVGLALTVEHRIAGETRFGTTATLKWANSWDGTANAPAWQTTGFSAAPVFRDGVYGPTTVTFTPPQAGPILITAALADQAANGSEVAPAPRLILVTDPPPGPRSDTFNRADATTLGTPSDGGSNWVALAGSWGVSSHQAYVVTPSGSNDAAVLGCGLSDVTVQVTLAAVGTYPGLIARATDNSNYWQCTFEPTQCYVHKNVAGTFTLVGTTHAGTFAAGDTVALRCSGDTITVVHNGVDLYSVTDPFNDTAVQHGLNAYTDSTSRFAAFAITGAGTSGGGGATLHFRPLFRGGHRRRFRP